MAEENNPYPLIGKQHKDGLDYIIDNLDIPANLNKFICIYIRSLFKYESTLPPIIEVMELDSIFTIAKNAYINNEYPNATLGQNAFINLLVNGIKRTPPLDIPLFIADIEENIAKSDLSTQEKMPLFFATNIGLNNHAYWIAEIGDSGSAWYTYFNSNAAVNIANVPYWVSAAMEGTIYYCFKSSYFTGEKEAPKMAGPNFVTALAASLAVGAGKVILGWVPKVSLPQLTLNMDIIANMDDESLEGAAYLTHSKFLCGSSRAGGPICICGISRNNCSHGVTGCPACKTA